jgi:hypothetical protein
MAQQGKTTGNLKMRSGPGMQFEPPIAYLVPDTALEILGEEGDWWKVRAAGKEGYVGKKYVAVTQAPPAAEAAPADTGAGKSAVDMAKGRAPIPPSRPAGSPAKPSMASRPAATRTSAPKASALKTTASKTTAAKTAATKTTAAKTSTAKTAATKTTASKARTPVRPAAKPTGAGSSLPKPGLPKTRGPQAGVRKK